jgi:hypothetical protein
LVVSLAVMGCVVDEPETSVFESNVQPHALVPEKELVITDKSVIEASVETAFDPAHPSGTTKFGAWSFGRLVHNMLPSGQRDSAAAASRFVLDWLATWESPQSPNAAVSSARARASIRLMITNPWKAASGCADPASPATDATCVLDMTKAPFRLMAIVYRPDLRIVAGNDTSIGGEGRFVFQVIGPTLGVNAASGAVEVMDATMKPQKFTVIFEYSLPVQNDGATITWAQQWHELGTKPWGNAFNAQLLGLTRDFSGPDQDRRRPNGNALDQLRTNEVALQGARFTHAGSGFVNAKQFWELREFHLTSTGLAPHTMNLEPARDFDVFRAGMVEHEGTRSPELVSFLNANAAAVLAATHQLPDGMSANSSLVGSSPYGAWAAFDGVAPAVRNSFAINTCAGCHRHETATNHFMHVTFVGAMEPNVVDNAGTSQTITDRALIGVESASDDTVALSNFLRAEISPGGARFEDFTKLIVTKRNDLRDKPGLRSCR